MDHCLFKIFLQKDGGGFHMSKKRVSVIVVHHSGWETTQKCLMSLIPSLSSDDEIVLVDNGSKDFNLKQVNRLLSLYPNIRVIHSKRNLHFTGGSNLGAQHACSEILAFINSDTIVTPFWLKPLVSFLKKHSEYLVQPKILSYSDKTRIDNAGGSYFFPGIGWGIGCRQKDHGQFDKVFRTEFVNGTCFLIHASFFNQLRGFDTRFLHHYEDVDLCLRAQKAGGACFVYGKSIIYHKVSQTFVLVSSPDKIMYQVRLNMLRIVQRHFTGFHRLSRLCFLLTLFGISIIVDFIAGNIQRSILSRKVIWTFFHESDFR